MSGFGRPHFYTSTKPKSYVQVRQQGAGWDQRKHKDIQAKTRTQYSPTDQWGNMRSDEVCMNSDVFIVSYSWHCGNVWSDGVYMNSDVFIVSYSWHCGNVWSDGVYMNSDVFIVSYNWHSALHSTQYISCTLNVYSPVFSSDIKIMNVLPVTQQLAFLSYSYVQRIFVFQHAI
jgi:hypothetical protein